MGIPWPSIMLLFCHGSCRSHKFELTPWNLTNGWRNTSSSFFHFQKMVVCHEPMAIHIRGDTTPQGISFWSCACVQDVPLSRDVEGLGKCNQVRMRCRKFEQELHECNFQLNTWNPLWNLGATKVMTFPLWLLSSEVSVSNHQQCSGETVMGMC